MGFVVVGLGPGNGRFLTREVWELLSGAEIVYLRTARHPAVAELPAHVQRVSFDYLYDTADSFESVYQEIVARLLENGRYQDVIYAVPGHPDMGEFTVTALREAAAHENLPVRVLPGVSFVEPMLTAVSYDGLDGVQIFDALELLTYKYPPTNPDVSLILGQVYSRLIASELKILLMTVYPDEHEVSLVHGAGTETELVETIPLYAIDHSKHIDHLTSLFVPALPYKASLPSLAETVAVLRSPEGCPWDQEQTPQSMREGLLEEVYEVLEAIDAEDPNALCEELGDVLYHLVMQAQMGSETEDFRLTDVIAGIEAKLKRRHPHVWGDWQVANSGEVVRNWEMLKQAEKGRKTAESLLDGIPLALPALARSQKIQSRVHKVGFDWPDIHGVYEKVQEELAELQAATTEEEKMAELGDLLFVIVNLARWLGVDAESALREANLRFTKRFMQVERLAAERKVNLKQMSLDELEALWQEAKQILASE